MSTRAVTLDEQIKLTLMMNAIGSRIDDATMSSALKNMNDNRNWIASNKVEISSFIAKYFNDMIEVENQLRLPKSSVPNHYKLHIDARNIHTGDKAYSGGVEISLTILEPTNYLIFHSKNQIVRDLKVFEVDGVTEIAFSDFHLYPAADTLTIYFDDNLTVGSEMKVLINYATTMMNYEAGFYQTSYVINGETRYLGATQFQATEARYAFPHYDEPAYKAIFELKITHNSTLGAISNMMGVDAAK